MNTGNLAIRMEDALVDRGLVSPDQMDQVRRLMGRKGQALKQALVGGGFIEEIRYLEVLSQVTGAPLVEELPAPGDNEGYEVGLLPIHFARKHDVFSFRPAAGEGVTVVVSRMDPEVLENVSTFFGETVKPLLAPHRVVVEAINRSYERSSDSAEEVIENLENGDLAAMARELDEPQDLLDSADEAPVINFLNSVLYEAVKARASDIHIEPFEGDLSIRYRVDGVLHGVHSLPMQLHSPIVSRVKVMADLDIAEKRLPQDGRIRIKIAGKDIDIRVSTVPTSFGERAVLRLLHRSQILLGLEEIGMSSAHLHDMERILSASHGICLVTGPTGSGKTTTLYGALTRINSADRNIITVEDPVEYQLKGISQIQVNPRIDLTFANGLRSILRQDPNVIMVGEIRDVETAEIAIQASLTGHLVFSTLHTNDAPGAVTRLIDMGIEPFLVASSITSILAQRLVRTICPDCREPYQPLTGELDELGLARTDIPSEGLYRGAGCQACIDTGYLGRTGIYELLLMSDAVKDVVLKNPDSGTVRKAALKQGMHTLRQDGAAKVLSGRTTIQEVLRVTQEEGGHAAV